MPLILKTECASCRASASYSEVVLVALHDDGSKTILRHPGEEVDAKAFGSSVSELRAQGRLRRAHPFLCRSCGEVDYASEPPARCKACNAAKLMRVAGAPAAVGFVVSAIAILVALITIQIPIWPVVFVAALSIPGVFFFDQHRSRKYQQVIKSVRCWKCGKRSLSEKTIGIS